MTTEVGDDNRVQSNITVRVILALQITDGSSGKNYMTQHFLPEKETKV